MARENPPLGLRAPPAPCTLGRIALREFYTNDVLGRFHHAGAVPGTQRRLGSHRDEPFASRRIPATAVLFRLLARLAAVTGVDDHLHMVRDRMPASKRLAAMLGRGAPHRAVRPLGAEGVCERPFETWYFDAMPVHHRDE